MSIERVQVSWSRWDARRMRTVTSHPYVWIWTDPEGTERVYNTKSEAIEARDSYE